VQDEKLRQGESRRPGELEVGDREAIRKNLAYLEMKRAPAQSWERIGKVTDQECDLVTWAEELRAQEFRD